MLHLLFLKKSKQKNSSARNLVRLRHANNAFCPRRSAFPKQFWSLTVQLSRIYNILVLLLVFYCRSPLCLSKMGCSASRETIESKRIDKWQLAVAQENAKVVNLLLIGSGYALPIMYAL
jgi:hypothetical protein